MQKIRALLVHAFCIFFPALVLFGVYGIILLHSILTEPAETPAHSQAADASHSTPAEADPFTQTALFTDDELRSGISLYETSLPGISQRFGANVRVESMVPSASSLTSAGQTRHSRNGSITTVEDSGTANEMERNPMSATPSLAQGIASDDPQNSALTPPPAWNPAEADIWRVETAYASRMNPTDDQFRKLVFYRWVDSVWQKQNASVFFESRMPAQPMVFYVHGNRTETNTATMQGLKVLQNFPTEVPARLILWSWDSERVSCRPRIEYSTKAHYADFQGFYLAEFIKKFEPETHIVLTGHSFGARTILNALHLLAGGTFGARTLESTFPEEPLLTEVSWKSGQDPAPNSASPKKPNGSQTSAAQVPSERSDLPTLDVLLVAPAVSCGALTPGAIFGRALETVSHLNLTQNSSDPALKFYPLMNGARNRLPEAMGFVGPSLNRVEDSQKAKVRIIRLDCQTHQFLEYLSMRSVQNGLVF